MASPEPKDTPSDTIEIPQAVQLATFEQLITELLKRFDNAIFVGERDSIDEEGKSRLLEAARWTGYDRTCQGLCTGMLSRLQKHHEDACEVISTEDL